MTALPHSRRHFVRALSASAAGLVFSHSALGQARPPRLPQRGDGEGGDAPLNESGRTGKPSPAGYYTPWEKPDRLDAFQEKLVLGTLPKGSRVLDVEAHRLGSVAGPLRVEAPDGTQHTLSVEMDRRVGGVEMTARVVPVLVRLGLPVGEVVAGPAMHPGYPNSGPMIVLAPPPGEPLQFWDVSVAVLDRTVRLMIAGVERLQELTGLLRQSEIGDWIPHWTPASELQGIIDRGGPWLEEPEFVDAVEVLAPAVGRIDTELVFSNACQNAQDFLSDGQELTGFVNFGGACFEDPWAAFSRHLVWAYDPPWAQFSNAGLVERYLYRHAVSRREHAPRLAVACLWWLQAEVPTENAEFEPYRAHVLALLRDCLDWIP